MTKINVNGQEMDYSERKQQFTKQFVAVAGLASRLADLVVVKLFMSL